MSLIGDITPPSSLPPGTRQPTYEHVFNDDLLMGPDDLKFARSHYSEIVHVLDNERLRGLFAQYERDANAARDRVRILGVTTVVFATVALITVATQVVWPRTQTARFTAILLELGGMFAAAVGSGSLWLGPWKRRWLESRFMAERLRQWHYQMMLRRGREIDRSIEDSDGLRVFERNRNQWLDEFLQGYRGHLDAKLEALVSELGDAETWVHSPPSAYRQGSRAFAQVCQAYAQLRLDHQYYFAAYKLRRADDVPMWRLLRLPAVRQAAVLSALSSVGLSAALAFSAALIYAHVVDLPRLEPALGVGAIVAALIGLALRTLQEGLAPEKEIERYSDYRGRVAALRDRFRQSSDKTERLRLMEELERGAVDEMRGFLRTHQSATFLLA